MVKIALTRGKLLDTIAARKLAPSRHVIIGWGADQVEDDLRLVKITVASQDWLPPEHLSEDAASSCQSKSSWQARRSSPCTPHIYRRSVATEIQEQFRRTVPAGDDKGSVVPMSFAATFTRLRRGFIVVTCKTKIRNLEDSFVVDQQVGSFTKLAAARQWRMNPTHLSCRDEVCGSVKRQRVSCKI